MCVVFFKNTRYERTSTVLTQIRHSSPIHYNSPQGVERSLTPRNIGVEEKSLFMFERQRANRATDDGRVGVGWQVNMQ